jgi:hypothetical protein
MKLKINLITTALVAIFMSLSLSSGHGESVTCKDGKKVWNYEKVQVLGWDLYIEKSISKDKALNDVIMKEVREGIERFIKIVPSDAIKFLQTIPIWASNEPTYPMRKNERGVIPFHRDKTWLRDHDLNPHMAPGVHIINPRAALLDHKIFEWGPMTMLHELAHAYHKKELKEYDPKAYHMVEKVWGVTKNTP